MKPSGMRATAWTVVAALLSLQVGCATERQQIAKAADFSGDVRKRTDEASTGPQSAPRAANTNFADALRCMDRLYITYGVRDQSMLIEDIADQTQKAKVGARDMFISAVSQMTRRSKAIRLVAYNASDVTLKEFLGQGTKVFDTVPEYSIRGSISMLDESVVKKQGDIGFNLGGFGTSAARQATSSVVGMDLNMIRNDDLSLVPGVTARNAVQVMREGTGVDGEALIKKFGLNFNFTLSKSEGQAQALRNLTELAAIELMGKLTRMPYWSCLGGSDKDPAVEAEILDWWESFAADPPTLVAYFQRQMFTRGLYRGDVDGQVNDALLAAIGAYQSALGLPGDAKLNADFFKRYLAADHAAVQPKALAVLPPEWLAAPPAKAIANAAPAGPLQVSLADPRGQRSYRRGEPYSVEVQLNRDGHLYCFLLDEKRQLNQFYPNPVVSQSSVKGGMRVRLPGNLPFRLVANAQGVMETVACFGSSRDLGPTALRDTAAIRDMQALVAGFKNVAGADAGMGVLDVKPQ